MSPYSDKMVYINAESLLGYFFMVLSSVDFLITSFRKNTKFLNCPTVWILRRLDILPVLI